MRNKTIITMFLLAGLGLAACSGKPVSAQGIFTPTNAPIPQQNDQTLQQNPQPAQGNEYQPQTDSQGAVTVEITPVNLSNPGDTLEFKVSMNTHSVNLSMDLATLANLVTDNGVSVEATKWDAPGGGHHIAGTLYFPASNNGKSVLEGATNITITIKDIDAPVRNFSWNLAK